MSAEVRRLAALLDAQSAMAATGLDRRALLTTVARHLCEMTGGDACLAELVDAEGEIYQAAAANTLAEAGVPLPTESLAGHAFFHDQLIRWDYNGIAVHVPDAAIGRPSKSALTAPLSVEGERLGVVSVVAGREGAFDEGDRDSVRRICRFAAHQLLQIQRYEEAQRTSRLDPLTNLGNRRALDESLETELARHIRYNRMLSLCVVDLNGFKRINDTYGHAAGDRVLRQVAEHLEEIRGADSAFRLGGDEFAILMPETGEGEAELVARRLARRIRDEAFPETLSASWGVAQATDTDAQALIAEADRRLYARKRGEAAAPSQQHATG
jgi:diguanylate cyclase (GGDEF)-like protein